MELSGGQPGQQRREHRRADSLAAMHKCHHTRLLKPLLRLRGVLKGYAVQLTPKARPAIWSSVHGGESASACSQL